MAQALSAAKAKVAVVARTEAQLAETVALIQKAGGQIMAVTADITDRKAVENMVQTLRKELGEIELGRFKCDLATTHWAAFRVLVP